MGGYLIMKKRCCSENIKETDSHSRRFLSGIYDVCRFITQRQTTCVEDPRQRHSGMTANGFTLIELLVVVLIIGILAAIALPQYQKAVEKSRALQGITLLKDIGNAVEIYYLEHGSYPTSFNQIDVKIPWTGNIKWTTNMVKDTRSNGEWSVQISANSQGNTKYYELWMGRISGPYAGTGFLYNFFTYLSKTPHRTVLCVERFGSGTIYQGKKAGDYCEKIWKGENQNTGANTYRAYKMP